jgi:CHAT domain-containing protein
VSKPRHQEFLARESKYQQEKRKVEEQIAAAGDDTAQVALLRGKLIQEWEAALAGMDERKRQEPELASLVSVNALTLPEVQKLLDKETTMLEYFLTEKKTLFWLVTRNKTEAFQVEIGGDSLKSLVMAFRKAIETEDRTDSLSRYLYDLLIAPAAEKIGTENLTVVPHGMLHYLPFAALQDHQGRYLLDDYKLSYLPSASVLKYLEPKRRSRGQALLALGNPAGGGADYTPLPLAAAEVRQIAVIYSCSRVLTGEQATEEAFKTLAPEYDILHLACHGDLNSAYPMYSGLLLAPGGQEDGNLQVHEILNLELNASLVVLSGCQTGLGHLTTGDELVGLSRAFIYAGAPSVLSSLWKVEDRSTAHLMSRFYQHLHSSYKAEALRLAQQETRVRYPELHAWASFVLIGDSE